MGGCGHAKVFQWSRSGGKSLRNKFPSACATRSNSRRGFQPISFLIWTKWAIRIGPIATGRSESYPFLMEKNMIEMSEESEDEAIETEPYLEHSAELIYDFVDSDNYPSLLSTSQRIKIVAFP
jgi:hypothetical protein